jgi:hypothetical protein
MIETRQRSYLLSLELQKLKKIIIALATWRFRFPQAAMARNACDE